MCFFSRSAALADPKKQREMCNPSPVTTVNLAEHGFPPCCLPLEGLLADSNFDLPRLGFCPLGQRDLQYALLIAGFHLLSVHGVRELKGADKRAIPALNAMEILFFFFLLKLALALNGQGVVFHADVDVLIVQAGNFQLEYQVLLVLIYVYRRNKAACGQLVFSGWLGKRLKEARQFAERIDSSDCHVLVSFK